jgi:geranylgeranyl reductase family protein
MLSTEVCIIGAGPAGVMAGLRLAKEGVSFVIVEKDAFPREKVCGDALSGKVPHIIRRLSPDILQHFEERCQPMHSQGIRFVAPGDHVFDVPFIAGYEPETHTVPGYTVKRDVLDAFMLDELQAMAPGTLLLGRVDTVERSASGFVIKTVKEVIRSRLLIDAAGTGSGFAAPYHRPLAEPRHTALAVRAYYEGVTGMHEQHFIELFFLEKVLPGYFWIFPLPDGQVNAGIGIRKDVVLKKKIKLSGLMDEIISRHPLVAPRFREARRLGKPEAHYLPLGVPRFRISGEGYMLAGDAAHLVDPLTGEGVGNAMYSGFIAAEQAMECIRHDDVSARFMKAYDRRIMRVLGKEMKMSRSFQRLLKYRRMVKWIAKKADGNKHIPTLMSSMFTDLSHRKKLMNPLFVLRVLLNR